MKKRYIFVCQMEESGEIFVGRQGDVDNEIRNYEVLEQDLPFTTIGRIEEPQFGLPLGFSDRLIEWYNKETVPEKKVIDAAVLKIIELLRN
jgi:hypothetical protein